MECIGCAPLMPVREAAERLGVSRRAVAALVADGVLVRPTRQMVVGGCVVERAAEDPEARHRLQLDVLRSRYDDLVASDESAALVLGLPVLQMPRFATATRSAGAWRGGTDGRVRIAPLPAHHVTEVDGIATTVAARTVVDISRGGTLAAAAVVGDAALRRGLPLPTLLGVLDECGEWADVGKARRAVAFLDARAESPFESMSRATMHEHGVPTPELQKVLTGASGIGYRVDFYWEAGRLIGEADGRQKYRDDDRRRAEEIVWAEKQREDDLREAGYDFVRWTYRQMFREAALTAARINRKLLPA